MTRTTHTYALLEVSEQTWNEIAEAFRKVGNYEHVFGDGGEIDMHGIALIQKPPFVPPAPGVVAKHARERYEEAPTFDTLDELS